VRSIWLCAALLLTGCASREPRADDSTYGCMQTVRAQIPTNLPDKRQHCLAGAQITRQCSVGEAYVASLGKELRDLFGTGDASWSDWRADRAGMRCGRAARDTAQIERCCAAAGY
jgi:hypothetical protein